MAGGPGFEPGLAESESAVLPLDDPPAAVETIITPQRRRSVYHKPDAGRNCRAVAQKTFIGSGNAKAHGETGRGTRGLVGAMAGELHYR